MLLFYFSTFLLFYFHFSTSTFPLFHFSTSPLFSSFSPVPYLLALAAAAFYGGADFLGGLAARRAHTSAVVVVSGAAGLILLAGLLPWMPGEPAAGDLAWGTTAGLAGGVGIGFLYRALAIGRMAVVAPTTAVCAVAIPAIAAFIFGERPSALTLAGMALALVAIVLVSQQQADPADREGPRRAWWSRQRGIGLALLSGVAIGVFYLTLAETSPSAGLWPLLAARAASVVLFGVVALFGRHSLRMDAPALRTVVACGVVDMAANAMYVIASQNGPLSIIVTLTSLYPASTVVLARVVLGERLSAWQVTGVACALVAVTMIVGGA
jgi:drug/metabolite transporter (DMT)-like permease